MQSLSLKEVDMVLLSILIYNNLPVIQEYFVQVSCF